MKIKLSKSQWQKIDQTAGWGTPANQKASPTAFSVAEIEGLLRKINELKEAAKQLGHCLVEPDMAPEVPEEKANLMRLLGEAKNLMIDVEGTINSEIQA